MSANYCALIRKHSWWKSTERLFLVIERHGNFDDENNFVPEQIVLLEYLTTKTSIVKWKDMIDFVDTGKLKDITKP